MTSVELFRLLNFKKNLYFTYVCIIFGPKYIMGDKLHLFMKNIQIFCIKLWYNNWKQNLIMQEQL